MHLGTVFQRLAQRRVERRPRRPVGLQVQKHHEGGIGVGQSGRCFVVVQMARSRAIQAQAAQTDRAHLEWKREHRQYPRSQGRRAEPRPLRHRAGGQVGVEDGAVDSNRLQARSLAELEMRTLQVTGEQTGRPTTPRWLVSLMSAIPVPPRPRADVQSRHNESGSDASGHRL